ncbi:MAG: sulfatase-like hydrolase/transferase [Acetivibrio sp.]
MKRIKQKIVDQKTIDFLNKYSIVFHWLLSCLLCFFIEAFSRHSLFAAVDFLFDRSWVFLYNSSIIFATFLIVYFFQRRTVARCIISCGWGLLGVVNGCLLLKRVTPFGYTDLKMIKDLFAMKNNYFNKTEIIIAIVAILGFVAFNIWIFKKAPKFKGKRHFLLSCALLSSCFLWIPALTKTALNKNLLTDYFSNIAQGYEKYGFVYGFSTSVVDRGMSEPENYTQEKIHSIQNEVKVPKTDTKAPNIIVVLLESFVDPEEINFLECSKDPVPNFHKLRKDYSSGYLKVPVVGAGTANTEFEILTGMSMRYFGTGEYPYKTVLKTNSCESIASDLNKIGYASHVIHNNGGNFYSRTNAFKQMGFDTFTSKEMMNIKEYTPLDTWAKDDILLDEIEKTMDSTKNQKDFIYTITVQGHGDYPKEKVIENPDIAVNGCVTESGEIDEGMNNAWEYYINELHEVDDFIGNLTEQLSQREEETLVVFFGDHLPSLNLKEKDMKSQDIFKTRYVTWDNFNMPEKDKELTATNLLAEMTGRVGIHEGTIFTYHQENGIKKETEDVFLKNLELLQYDVLYGEHYAYNGEDLYPASDLVMGSQDIKITGTEQTYDHKLYVCGDNFTPWSRVFINGEKVNAVFNGEHELFIKEMELKKGDTIVVNQMGSQSTVFRTSNEIIIE